MCSTSNISIVEAPWTQPAMSDYGTMGGSSFAVSCSSQNNETGFQVFYAFRDPNLGNTTGARYGWWANAGGTQYCTIYNPNPLKISLIQIQNSLTDTNGAWKEWAVQGSDDGATFYTLASGQNTISTTAAFWDMDISSSKFYNYHRILISSTLTYGIPRCSRITLSATQRTANPEPSLWAAPSESRYYISY